MARVLCTGSDQLLLQTRTMLLELGGHSVTGAMSEPEVLKACAEQSFDVVVIGQGVAPPVKQHILGLIRQHCPAAKVLELYPAHQNRALQGADDYLEVPAQAPYDLVERVSELAGGTKAKKRKPRKDT